MTVLIKLGGSLITDKSAPLSLKPKNLKQISEEIGNIYKINPKQAWLIGNGAGSFGHYTVHKVNYKANPADKSAIKAVRQSVASLNKHVVDALKNAGLPAVSLPPSTFIHEQSKKLVCKIDVLLSLLQDDKIPVIYGDVIDSDKQGSRIISTEEALDFVARQLIERDFDINTVIYASSTDGVLDQDNKTIKQLYPADVVHKKANSKYDVTGGMAQKVQWGFKALDFSQKVLIIDGTKSGSLTDVLNGKSSGTQLIKH